MADREKDRVESLSLGNQQRVQLAAALVHEPDVLVLDEPFSGLDPVGTDVLVEVLDRERRTRGVPIVFSSHQLELVERVCDRVAMIVDGRIVADGAIDEAPGVARTSAPPDRGAAALRPAGSSRSRGCDSRPRCPAA